MRLIPRRVFVVEANFLSAVISDKIPKKVFEDAVKIERPTSTVLSQRTRANLFGGKSFFCGGQWCLMGVAPLCVDYITLWYISHLLAN